jgi:putative photosynthetic complex assembly protein 2
MVWRGPATFRRSLAACSLLGVGGLLGLAVSSRVASIPGAYLGFTSALLVWAWHELVFLLGAMTGPRKEPCPSDATGGRRFLLATSVVLHHEIALALTAALIVGLTAGQPNQAGTWAFLVLWVMRLSAKFNVFLGVPNLNEHFVPPHLRYITSYFRRARLNPLMPFSLVAGGLVVAALVAPSLAPAATPFLVVSHTLVATLLGLAVLEHLFLAIPVPDAVLWRWALRAPPPALAGALVDAPIAPLQAKVQDQIQ